MPTLVINACGAWIDLVNQRIGPTPPRIGGTKGSHVVIDNARLREVMAGRAFFSTTAPACMCIAYTLDKMVLLGLTDDVRPLSRSRSKDTVNISRSRSIARRDADPKTPFSVLSLVGGRWTTFGGFGQRGTYRVLAGLELSRRQRTENLPIDGGNQFPRDDAGRPALGNRSGQRYLLVVTTVEGLRARYGTQARQVAAF